MSSAIVFRQGTVTDLVRRHAATILFLLAGLVLVIGPSFMYGRIPGDLGDARFSSYVLEHFFRWVTRQDASFWNANFFYPFPLTIAFSENWLGDAFVYGGFRAIGFAREDAFRAWFVTGYVIDFAAAEYALARLGYSKLAAALGAFLFAFGLPVTAQEGHAQLIYRFGVPLGVLAFEKFLAQRQLRQLSFAAFWVTWQFYCSIYIGYFLTLLLLALAFGHTLSHSSGPIAAARSVVLEALRSWTSSTARAKVAFLLTIAVLVASVILLCVPYMAVNRLYGFQRPWSEIVTMLPRPVSYLLAGNSRFLPRTGTLFDGLPMRHEHAMFIGFAPFLAIAVAAVLRLGKRADWDRLVAPAALSIVLLVVLTLWVDGHSLYRALAWLPGVNAIRGMTRIILVLLFPCGLLLASSVDTIRGARAPAGVRFGTVTMISVLLLFESSYITHYTTSEHEWQARMAAVAAELPPTVPQAPILLLAPSPRESLPLPTPHELDAMLFAQDRGWRTLNGYSSNIAPGHQVLGLCQDAARLIATALAFLGHDSKQCYDALMRDVVMAGYPSCDHAVLPRYPRVTVFAGPVPTQLMANIEIHIEQLEVQNNQAIVTVSIDNKSSVLLPAYSFTTPIRLLTRFVDAGAAPTDPEHGPGWSRQDVAFDIPPGTSQQVEIGVAPPADPGSYRVEVSMVQDNVAFFHDHGMHIPVSAQTVDVNEGHIAHISNRAR